MSLGAHGSMATRHDEALGEPSSAQATAYERLPSLCTAPGGMPSAAYMSPHIPLRSSYAGHATAQQPWPATSTMEPCSSRSRSPGSSPEPPVKHEEAEPKKRRRIQQACKNCSARRVKCDGQKPCQTCVKGGEECVYGQPKKRGPPKGTIRGAKKSFLPSYSRDECVEPERQRGTFAGTQRQHGHPPFREGEEDACAYEADKRPSSFSHTRGADPHRRQPSGAFSPHSRKLSTRTHEQDAGASPSTSLAAPREAWKSAAAAKSWEAIWTEKLARGRDVDPTDMADFALEQMYRERVQSRSKKREAAGPNGIAIAAPQGQVHVTLEEPFVPRETTEKLFDAYWCLIGLHWPLFSRNAYPTVESLRCAAEKSHPLLFNAICAISARVWEKNNDACLTAVTAQGTLTAEQLSTIFYVRAHYYHTRASTEPSLESTAAMILLSLLEAGMGRSTQAAHFCWTACRMVTDLGLQRRGEAARRMDAELRPVEEDFRRRVYWCAFVLDKNMAAQLGRPPVLRDAESDCPLPELDRDEDAGTWAHLHVNIFSKSTNDLLGPTQHCVSSYFRHGCRLALIAEEIIGMHTVVKGKRHGQASSSSMPTSTVASLHHRLETWIAETPEHLRWHPGAPRPHLPYVLHQQVWSQACKILLHRPYILKPADDALGFNSHVEASKAANNIIAMFVDYERYFPLQRVSSSTVYCLFSAATISLGNLTSLDPSVVRQAKAQLRSLVQWFTEIAETWSAALQHLAILERLAASMKVDLSETGMHVASTSSSAAFHRQSIGMPTGAPLGIGVQSPYQQSTPGEEATRTLSHDGSRALHTPQRATPAAEPAPSHTAQIPPLPLQQPPYLEASGRLPLESSPVANGHTGAYEQDAIEAFWPDMPLGENFQRWASFTETYLGILGNATAPTSTAAPTTGMLSPTPPAGQKLASGMGGLGEAHTSVQGSTAKTLEIPTAYGHMGAVGLFKSMPSDAEEAALTMASHSRPEAASSFVVSR